MNRPFTQIPLILVLGIVLLPTVVIASGIGTDTPPSRQEQSVNDNVTVQMPGLPQIPDIKYHDAGAPQETGGNPSGAYQEGHKEKIKVVYDTETEQDRGKMIALVIAFGVSLALNIYLATALYSSRRGY